MEQFLTPKLEKEVSEISLEYIYKKELIFPDCPGFVKRNLISTKKHNYPQIIDSWMTNGLIPTDIEAWEYLKKDDLCNAYMRMSAIGDMIIQNFISLDSPFNIIYCPEKMQEFQKYRLRLWWEYCEKRNEFLTLNANKQEQNTIHYLEQEQILNDEYIHTLARKFYPEEYK